MLNIIPYTAIIRVLIRQYSETRDIIYINHAIGFTEGVIKAKPPANCMQSVESILSGLWKYKTAIEILQPYRGASPPPVDDGVADSTSKGVLNRGIPITSMDDRRVIRILDDPFNKTARSEVVPNFEAYLEIFQALMRQYSETGNIIYLNYAIGFTGGMIKAKPLSSHMRFLEWIFPRLFQIKDWGPAIIQIPEQNKGTASIPVVDGLAGLTSGEIPNRGIPITIKNDRKAVNILDDLFKTTGDITFIQSAISLLESMIAETLHPKYNQFLRFYLCTFLEARFHRLGDLDDLERACQGYDEALALIPPGHPYRAGMLMALRIYSTRFERLGSLEDIAKAIDAYKEIRIISPNHPITTSILGCLAQYYNQRYERLGDLVDLNRAIRAAEEAAVAPTPIDEDEVTCLNILGNSLAARFNCMGDIGDLENAILVAERVVAVADISHSERVKFLNDLSNHLRSRFIRLGNIDDIDRAILVSSEALQAIPHDHPGRATIISNLGCCYSTRFARFGGLHDLEQAIWARREGMEAIPEHHPRQPFWLHNTSLDFYNRYRRFGALADINLAVQACEEALARSPLDHPARAVMFYNYAQFLHCRFVHSGDLDDLEKAIQASEKVVETMPLDHPFRTYALSCLGDYLSSRWDHFSDPRDLTRAIQASKQAVAATPLDHPHRAANLIALSSLYGKIPFDHIQMVLKIRKRAGHSPEMDSDLYGVQINVVGCSGTYSDTIYFYNESNGMELEDQEQWSVSRKLTISLPDMSLKALLEAWQCEMAPPRHRIHAACLAAKILASASRWKEGGALLLSAIRILPQLSPQFLGRDDQEYMLSGFTPLVSDAISMTLQAGATPFHCLNLLEFGRGVIMGLAINCRSHVSDLKGKYPYIFKMFDLLRTKIDSPLHNYTGNESSRRRRVEHIRRFDKTLASIRQLPGFERFQLGPSLNELVSMAADGPIIIFNTTELRSDAIIVTSSIRSVALPKMIYSDVKEKMGGLTGLVRGNRSTYSSRNQAMDRYLLWLWEVAVEPVFEVLGFTTVDDSKLPRVWWIGVGPLATAPFHAAGDHSRHSTRNTISLAISSYIPTVKSLLYAREKKLDLRCSDTRLLLVTTSTTSEPTSTPTISAVGNIRANRVPALPHIRANSGSPDKKWKPLKNVRIEAGEIMDAVGGVITTRLDQPSAALVLENLSSHDVIHLACHGVSDSNNPSNSHLVLPGSSSYEKLTVGAISALSIRKAQVAYLSACCTADNSCSRLADESIHIASGFLLAGFSHVLATLWDSNDDACRQVAGEFYRTLFNGQPESAQGHRAVSAAHHHAVRQLRGRLLRQPIKWASFIHTGA